MQNDTYSQTQPRWGFLLLNNAYLLREFFFFWGGGGSGGEFNSKNLCNEERLDWQTKNIFRNLLMQKQKA